MAKVRTPITSAPARPVTVRIANKHTAPILFPRAGGSDAIIRPPLTLQPGTITEVDAEEWREKKKMQVVQHMLDKGMIAETHRRGEALVTEPTSSVLEVPEHLQTEVEAEKAGKAPVYTGNDPVARASRRRATPGAVIVD